MLCIFALLFHFAVIISPYLQAVTYIVYYFCYHHTKYNCMYAMYIYQRLKTALLVHYLRNIRSDLSTRSMILRANGCKNYFFFKLKDTILNVGSQKTCKMSYILKSSNCASQLYGHLSRIFPLLLISQLEDIFWYNYCPSKCYRSDFDLHHITVFFGNILNKINPEFHFRSTICCSCEIIN